MAFGQGSETLANVTATSSGIAVTFTNQPPTVYVFNGGVSDIKVSFSSTAGSTDGFVMRTATSETFVSKQGYFAGVSFITTAAGSTAPVSVLGLQ